MLTEPDGTVTAKRRAVGCEPAMPTGSEAPSVSASLCPQRYRHESRAQSRNSKPATHTHSISPKPGVYADLVLIPCAVHGTTEFAIGWRQTIIHAMLYRLNRAQVREDRF